MIGAGQAALPLTVSRNCTVKDKWSLTTERS
jgi:hypothetical protein